MLYFLNVFSDGGDIFNLFRYITFRAGGAFFTALCFGFVFGQPLINFLREKQKSGSPRAARAADLVRDDLECASTVYFAQLCSCVLAGLHDYA